MRNFLAAIIIMLSSLIISGCAGGLFNQDCSKLPVNSLEKKECSASQGDQQAQFELGVEAFNAGDTNSAIKWFERAAQKRPSRLPIYVPPVGNQSAGAIMLVETNNGTNGHGSANFLLYKIYSEGLGVEIDKEKADKYRRMGN